MAYGKDPAILDQVGSFRQESTPPRRPPPPPKQASRGVPYYVDRYKPTSGTTPDRIRLLAGSYLQPKLNADGTDVVQVKRQYIMFTEHYDGVAKRSAICSGGPFVHDRTRREPCLGCDIFWQTAVRDERGKFDSPRMSRQTKYAFGVFDYSPYHKVDKLDHRTGQVKMNPNTGKPYYDWAKCDGQRCENCRAQREVKQGHFTHWPMSYTEHQLLLSAAAGIERSCVTCRNKDCIQTLAWECRACHAPLIDMSTTTMKDEEINQMTAEEVTCSACGHYGFLDNLIECSVCDREGKQARCASPFDVDLEVKYVLVAGKHVLQISGWSTPSLFDPLAHAAAGAPIDLLGRYAPSALEDQDKRFSGYVG